MIDVLADKDLFVNIRYLCWQANPDRSTWPVLLARWLELDEHELGAAIAMLNGLCEPTPAQIDKLAMQLALDPQELIFGSLASRGDENEVLKQNVIRLLDGRGDLSQGQLADQIGVAAATVTRWRKGVAPDKHAKKELVKYFGLRSIDELETRPIFLSYLPVTHAERVAWIQEHIHRLGQQRLRELFPALMRLLEGN